MNAIRAMYPTSSKIESNTNSTNIWGTKPNTAPTPPIIPSTTKPTSHPAMPSVCSHVRIFLLTNSPNNTSLVQSVTADPTVVMER